MGGADVVFAPAPAPLAVGDVPLVLMVHDRSWEVRPKDFTSYERLWHRLARPRALARRAGHLITPTDAVAREVAAAWDVPLPVAIHHAPREMPPPGEPPEGPYVLFVGALEPRKAPDMIPAALPAGVALRVVGKAIDVPGAIREGRVDDERLSTLYAGARALVLPSHLEGFGLPAIEALAAGCPVVAADLPALREVLGDRARYVPPGDVGALRAAIADPPPRPAAGRTRSWTDVARETRAVLSDAAGRR